MKHLNFAAFVLALSTQILTPMETKEIKIPKKRERNYDSENPNIPASNKIAKPTKNESVVTTKILPNKNIVITNPPPENNIVCLPEIPREQGISGLLFSIESRDVIVVGEEAGCVKLLDTGNISRHSTFNLMNSSSPVKAFGFCAQRMLVVGTSMHLEIQNLNTKHTTGALIPEKNAKIVDIQDSFNNDHLIIADDRGLSFLTKEFTSCNRLLTYDRGVVSCFQKKAVSFDTSALFGDQSGNIVECDLNKAALLQVSHLHDKSVSALCGLQLNQIASGGSDGTLKLFDKRYNKEIASIAAHPNTSISAIVGFGYCFDLVSTDADGNLKYWDPRKLKDPVHQGKLSTRIKCADNYKNTAILLGGGNGKLYTYYPQKKLIYTHLVENYHQINEL